MDKRDGQNGEKILYQFRSFGPSDWIETTLLREKDDCLSLHCRRVGPDGSEDICLTDLGRGEADCVCFARFVAESHTRPRILAELWEEFM